MIEAVSFAAAGFLAALAWRRFFPRLTRRLPVTVTVDASDPRAADIADYLAKIAARLDERPEKMRVTFDSPEGITLDLERDGRLVIHVNGQPPRKLNLRNRWIADHPVPIALRGLSLYIDPVDANRFRVNDRTGSATPLWIALPLSLAAAAGLILSLAWLTGLAAGIGLGSTVPFRRA